MDTAGHRGTRSSDRRIAGALLLLLFTLLISGARQLAPTADETAHLAGGYSLIVRPREALAVLSQRGYPPLMPALQGALIALSHPHIDVGALPGWPDSFDIFAESFAAAVPIYDRALFVGRLPAIWLTVLLGAIAYRWSALAFGRRSGLIALGLCLVDPTLLAHGRLATTDAGVTSLGLASLYAAWRWTRVGGWRWSLTCGVLLGATMLVKVSGALWVATAGLIMLTGAIFRRPHRVSAGLLHVAATALLACVVLWAAYGFQIGPLADIGLVVPAPSHWESTFYLTSYHSLSFALGQRQRESWWWYFPAAFIIKNPLPLLLFWLTGILALVPYWRLQARLQGIRGSARRSIRCPPGLGLDDAGEPRGAVSRLALGTVLVFPFVYSVVAVLEGMNIGYRHMLPIHPLLHIAAGLGLAKLWQPHRPVVRGLLLTLGALCAVGTWRQFPDELAFFSALVGGPDSGYRYLVDSNLDWGQNADDLATYLAAHPEVSAGPPETPLRPAPGRYIVGASALQGVGSADPYAYEWFRHREPDEQPVPGLLVYAVAAGATAWVAQCSAPEVPLTLDELASGVGEELRAVSFDCREAWLLPQGGVTPGIYALPGELLAPPVRRLPSGLLQPPDAIDPALQRWLVPTRLSFLNLRVPHPFALYEFDPQTVAAARLSGAASAELGPATTSPIYAVPAETLPTTVAPGTQTPTYADLMPQAPRCPCTLDGPLTFLGISVQDRDGALDIETWWRVDEGPIARSFSLMGHLLGSSGEALGTDDGAGVLPTTLLAGDVFVQLHRFTGHSDAPELWFRTGAYWLDTKALWPVNSTGGDAFLVRVR